MKNWRLKINLFVRHLKFGQDTSGTICLCSSKHQPSASSADCITHNAGIDVDYLLRPQLVCNYNPAGSFCDLTVGIAFSHPVLEICSSNFTTYYSLEAKH
jgi:hypothetical protein